MVHKIWLMIIGFAVSCLASQELLAKSPNSNQSLYNSNDYWQKRETLLRRIVKS